MILFFLTFHSQYRYRFLDNEFYSYIFMIFCSFSFHYSCRFLMSPFLVFLYFLNVSFLLFIFILLIVSSASWFHFFSKIWYIIISTKMTSYFMYWYFSLFVLSLIHLPILIGSYFLLFIVWGIWITSFSSGDNSCSLVEQGQVNPEVVILEPILASICSRWRVYSL